MNRKIIIPVDKNAQRKQHDNKTRQFEDNNRTLHAGEIAAVNKG